MYIYIYIYILIYILIYKYILIKCKWFDDYLSDRRQRVVINGNSYSWKNVKAGVPQHGRRNRGGGGMLSPKTYKSAYSNKVNICS